MNFFLPLRLREHDRRTYDALQSDKPITSLDILKLEYVAWPPNGVKYDPRAVKRLEQQVEITSVSNDQHQTGLISKIKSSVITLGYIYGTRSSPSRSEKREIYLNSYAFSTPGQILSQIMSFQIGKRLIQSASFLISVTAHGGHNWKNINVLPFCLGLSSMRYSYLNMAVSLFNPQKFPIPKSITDTVGHEHFHVLQTKDAGGRFGQSAPRMNLNNSPFRETGYEHLSDESKATRDLDNIFGFGAVKYLCRDKEVQARLHSTLAQGYHRWGKLPETRAEFWAALIDSGLMAPKDIRRNVAEAAGEKESGAEVRRFLVRSTFFKLASSVVLDASAELNVASTHHKKLALGDYFWNNTLPYLYGHLLELYGDPSGREKMGFKKTQRPYPAAKSYFPPEPTTTMIAPS